ncbi:MAG: D-aminoacylase [Saprospiraceae bacterium]|nr:D-aminoacylase [Saprospiraceae bacterium]
MERLKLLFAIAIVLLLFSCQREPQTYDLIIRNAMIYDGSGNTPKKGDIAINADTIAAIGNLKIDIGKQELDAQGMAVSPGFINMLSWATNLAKDGRGMSDIKQGVTLEVMGEGSSLGPHKEPTITEDSARLTTFADHFEYLEKKGISLNVASFVGATTVRVHEVGYEDRLPTPEELEKMKALVRQSMEEGAMGVGSSLIYAPAFYAKTDELIELCKVASEYGGMYITHMRSEGNRIEEAVDEVITIAREANLPAEIYHLKFGGKDNWSKIDKVLAQIDKARAEGLNITTDMYLYTAGSTGLDAAMPPWVQEGGYAEWAKRLQQPDIRKRVIEEMKTNAMDWENLYYLAGADQVLLVGFNNETLRDQYTGKTLAEVAKMRNQSPEDAAIDLVVQDGSRVQVVYFLMSEDNVKRQIKLPYMSFGSDAGAPAAEGEVLKSSTHPRTYGNFARLLGKYVRDEKVIPLQEAIHKLTHLSAKKLKISDKRGLLKPGYYADIVIFDPNTIQDHATFEKPHQYASGVQHVFVNGVQVLKDGEHTGATPGRFVRGPGFKKD